MVDDSWLTVTEITQRLKVHRETVRRWLRDGRLEGRNFGGKMGYRVRARDLERFLAGEDGQEKTGGPPSTGLQPEAPHADRRR